MPKNQNLLSVAAAAALLLASQSHGQIKISSLPTASTPLTGAEALPAVQSSTTKKLTVSNIKSFLDFQSGTNRKSLDSFGADNTGVVDATAILNTATQSFGALGGTLCLTPGATYKITSTVLIGNATLLAVSTINGVVIETCDAEGNIPAALASVKWSGAVNGVMFSVRGGSGNALRHVVLDANSLASTGLQISSASYSTYEDILVKNWVGGFAIVDTASCATSFATGSGWNHLRRLFTLSAGTGGSGLLMDGCPAQSVDATQSTVEDSLFGYVGTASTYGIAISFADNNVFSNVGTFPNNGSYGGGGKDITFTQQSGGLAAFPYGNVFVGYAISPNGVAGTSGTAGNYFLAYNLAAGGTWPSISYINGNSNFGVNKITKTLFASISGVAPAPTVGDEIVITDASACTANVAVAAGGGTTHSCPAIYNGTSWLAVITH